MNGKSLKDFDTMPFPYTENLSYLNNIFVLREISYDLDEMATKHLECLGQLNVGQRLVYDEIVGAVTVKNGGLFFVDGYGGTRKTFL